MIEHEFETPHLFTAGYVGEPGDRTFLLQIEDELEHLTLLCEKGQVAGLAELLTDLLSRVDDEPATDWDRDAMGLREPLEPAWRLGELAVGLDAQRGRFVVDLTEFVPGDDPDVEPVEVRVWADQDQARRLAAHAVEVIGQGRPTCPLCGRPTAPDGGHTCPATNGHGRLTS